MNQNEETNINLSSFEMLVAVFVGGIIHLSYFLLLVSLEYSILIFNNYLPYLR